MTEWQSYNNFIKSLS